MSGLPALSSHAPGTWLVVGSVDTRAADCGGRDMIVPMLTWYIALQACGLAALPLAQRVFSPLPDRGLAFTKALGVFLVGVVLWLGTSYGLLRNDLGGAWLAIALVAVASAWAGRETLAGRGTLVWRRLSIKYVLAIEGLFLLAYVLWATVRMYDPAANHTEQPMDLMFMNAITASPTYPPRDAWLAGYPISYYYLGYWLLTTLGFLSGNAPGVAFNIGQASWFALLLVGSFGIVYNLLATPVAPGDATPGDQRSATAEIGPWPAWHLRAGLGGLLAAAIVGVMGNLQIMLEWLYARGYDIASLARWVDVDGFPGDRDPSGLWYIGSEWWWWRASRVVQDKDLLGNHIEVIDEFPFFSYLLGDNHPHVLAMPMVLVVIALTYSVLLSFATCHDKRIAPAGGVQFRTWLRCLPGGVGGLAVLVVVSGGLLFLNTWDYPPYWLLLIACAAIPVLACAQSETHGPRHRVIPAIAVGAAFGVVLIIGAAVVYFPYLLTAQSQVKGITPNLFNPTRFAQFLLMFGAFMPAIGALAILAWHDARPAVMHLAVSGALTFGVPLLFLGGTLALAFGTQPGRARLADTALPEGAASHMDIVLQRWTSHGWTFVAVGLLLMVTLALIWRQVRSDAGMVSKLDRLFALLLAALGLGLIFVPEFVFLRDNFATRMNTIFKFYYQAWLLLGLAAAYAIAIAFSASYATDELGQAPRLVARGLAVASVMLVAAGLLYPVAGVFAKTGRFSASDLTLDATAYVERENPHVAAAAAWVKANTPFDAVIAEGKGKSYWATYSRISALTGRPTLLGWDGHESQWRGGAYNDMAGGRSEALDKLYRGANPDEIAAALAEHGVDYVYVGPTERDEYAMTPDALEQLDRSMDLVFHSGDVRIYRTRGQPVSRMN